MHISASTKEKIATAVFTVSGAGWNLPRKVRGYLIDHAQGRRPFWLAANALEQIAWISLRTGCALVDGIKGRDPLDVPRLPHDPYAIVESLGRAVTA